MKGFWRLLGFLVRTSRKIPRARLYVVLVVFTGAVGGIANVGLLALINKGLHDRGSITDEQVWLFAGLCLLVPISRVCSQYVLTRLSQDALLDLRLDLSGRILETPTRKLEEVGPHQLLATLTGDVDRIAGALINIPLLCIHGTVLMCCLLYMAYLSPFMLSVVLFFVFLGGLCYRMPTIFAFRYFQEVRIAWDDMFKQMKSLIDGNKELKMHRNRRSAFMDEKLSTAARSIRLPEIRGNVIYALGVSTGQVLFFVLIGLFLFVLPATRDSSPELLSGFTLVTMYMFTPLSVVMEVVPSFSRATVALDKVHELGLLLEAEAEPQPSGQPSAVDEWSVLQLDGVTHTYYREKEAASFVLGPIDLELRRGEIVFLVGGNGCGKTTLAKIFVGLYGPEAGRILMDGQEITESTRDDYRQHFSVVFNDFYLFEDLLGLAGDSALTQSYLEQLQLDHKVEIENGKLSTLDLSQGQRKRLALLTAYLEDRPIYVFDEWAADQDPEFKNFFYTQLLPALREQGKTVLAITHDDRYYDLPDRIFRLEYGRLEYDGDPAGYQLWWDSFREMTTPEAQSLEASAES